MEVPASVSKQKPHVSVYLSSAHSDVKKYFHCNICGHKVFGYYDDTKIILSGEGKFKKSPIEIQCNGAITEIDNEGRMITRKCKTLYYIG